MERGFHHALRRCGGAGHDGGGLGRVAAARAAVILTAEPVFVVAFTPLVGGAITGRALLGGAIIVAAVAIVEAERARRGSTQMAGW